MFPNHLMFLRVETDEQRERRERRIKEDADEDRQAIMYLTYCCLCTMGLLLSKCGRAVELVGQRMTWYAMSKKGENAPWHYH